MGKFTKGPVEFIPLSADDGLGYIHPDGMRKACVDARAALIVARGTKEGGK